LHDLNSESGRESVGLDDDGFEGVKVVGLRVHDGDDASCFNLNRAQRPRLLGVQQPPPVYYYHFVMRTYRGRDVIVSRTGYTGELGYEIYLPTDLAVQAWRECLELGATPAGLGARDTLRLEMGYPLYGHELNPDRNAAESGFNRAIATEKSFLGCDPVRGALQHPAQQLTGLLLDGRRAARHGDRVTAPDGNPVGTVTSGSFSPSLRRGIAMAYVDVRWARPGTSLSVATARTPVTAVVTETPFYREGSARSG